MSNSATFTDIVQITCTLSDVFVLECELRADGGSETLVDSSGNILIDSNGNELVDYAPGIPINGILNDTINISATLSEVADITGKLSISENINASISLPNTVGGQYYHGSYTVTPADEVQILETKNLQMTDNVTINPIPSNYGKITWNGSFLTVS